MTTASQGILDAALSLPEPERVFVVQGLLDSLSPDTLDDAERISTAELDRRYAEIEQGKAGEISWAELKQQK